MSSHIKQCQDKGKIVTLSIGGAISQVGFSTNSQARTFADKIWNTFLGGSGRQRPFGDAVLDGYAALFVFPSSSGLLKMLIILPCSHFFSVVVVVHFLFQGSI